jgi:hypothetical protein
VFLFNSPELLRNRRVSITVLVVSNDDGADLCLKKGIQMEKFSTTRLQADNPSKYCRS